MRIRLFYPLAFLLVAGMVFYAMRPGLVRVQEWQETLNAIPREGLRIGGEGLRAIVVNERASVELQEGGSAPYAVIGSSGTVDNDQVNGAHYFVPSEVVRRLLGVEVDVMFNVRAAPEDGSFEWLARAVIPGVLDTGWLLQEAGAEWSIATLHIAMPQTYESEEPLGLMMWSDAIGDGGRVELREILIRPAGPVREASQGTLADDGA